MLKLKKRLILSIFCLVLSCGLTIIYLLNADEQVMNASIKSSLKLATSSKISNNENQNLEEVDIKESDIYADEISEDSNNSNDDESSNTDKSTNTNVEEETNQTEKNVVYDGLTMDELADKLNRSLKNELSNKGYLYASYSIEKGVDPYLATAISLEETGCNYNCSNLIKTCNNVGGMKGSGCGSYGYFNSLDEGIKAFIDNISRNYVAYGLTTADTMNPKYAENPAWAHNVNNYITRIKNN